MFIPVNEPVVSRASKANVNRALKTGWLSSAGPFVGQFEHDFARYLGVKHAITVNTGTAALHIALLAGGVGVGDEVIVPAFTMASTWLAVIYTGATPVFVDAEPTTYNIDPTLIEAKITKRTKAILPVHVYGHPADMDTIMRIAKKHQLLVIEDAAEAHGATYQGKIVGGIGNIGCFSFYANKLITTGEGGMVVTDDDSLAEEAKKFKDLYHSPQKRFIHEKVGYNYRMTNLQAGVGVGELQHVDKYIKKKIHMANRYTKQLRHIHGITTPQTLPGCTNIHWMYAIRINPHQFGMTKDELRNKLKSEGIDTRDFFYAPGDQPVLVNLGLTQDDYPVTQLIAKTGLYLPSGLAITNAQIDHVCDTLENIYEKTQQKT